MSTSIVIDNDISRLTGLMFTAPDQFFDQTKKFAATLTPNDLSLLRSRLHADLPVPENIDNWGLAAGSLPLSTRYLKSSIT